MVGQGDGAEGVGGAGVAASEEGKVGKEAALQVANEATVASTTAKSKLKRGSKLSPKPASKPSPKLVSKPSPKPKPKSKPATKAPSKPTVRCSTQAQSYASEWMMHKCTGRNVRNSRIAIQQIALTFARFHRLLRQYQSHVLSHRMCLRLIWLSTPRLRTSLGDAGPPRLTSWHFEHDARGEQLRYWYWFVLRETQACIVCDIAQVWAIGSLCLPLIDLDLNPVQESAPAKALPSELSGKPSEPPGGAANDATNINQLNEFMALFSSGSDSSSDASSSDSDVDSSDSEEEAEPTREARGKGEGPPLQPQKQGALDGPSAGALVIVGRPSR